VMQYNWLMRRNKAIGEELGKFSNDLHGYMMSGGQVKPTVASAAARPAPASTARPTGTGGPGAGTGTGAGTGSTTGSTTRPTTGGPSISKA